MKKPIRSIGVRGADLVAGTFPEQLDLFMSFKQRDELMKMDAIVDYIRQRFRFYSVQRGLMFQDKILSSLNAREDHTVHPQGYFE